MKLFTFIMLICCMHVSAALYSQEVTLMERNIKLEKVLEKLEQQTGFTFFFKNGLLKNQPEINISLRKVSIEQALSRIFDNTGLKYDIIDQTVVINRDVSVQPISVPSENFIVTGKVTDKNGLPLPGVNITPKGAGIKRNFTTNNDGFFFASLSEDVKALVFTYTGYKTRTVDLDGKKVVNVVLEDNINTLDQVQVTAYGTTTLRTSTTTITHVSAQELERSPARNVLEIIKDRVPGMFVQQNTGITGGSFNVNIRGVSSFNGTPPLFVIDGVTYPADGPLPLAKPPGADNQFLGGNALNYLNPADIESIDILKDADATAIYGSRGAYGVVLITTKKAKAGKSRINLNSSTGITMRGSFPKMLGLDDYLMLRREALKNDGLQPTATDLDLNGIWPLDRVTDWQRELTGGTGLTNATNLTYSGGNGATNFLIAANYNRQGSTDPGKGSNRGGGVRFNLNTISADGKFSIDFSGDYKTTLNDIVPIDFSGSVTNASAPNAPPLRNADGSPNWTDYPSNPLGSLNLQYRGITNNLITSSSLKYKVLKDLTLQARLGYNQLMGNEFRATPTTAYRPGLVGSLANTRSQVNDYNIRTINFDPYLVYVREFGPTKLTVTGGGRFQDQLRRSNSITGSVFATDALLQNPASATSVVATYDKQLDRILGFFGIANYSILERYFISATYNREGSTKFGADNRWGDFGSLSANWIFSEEKWMRENLKFISFAKINGSYGTTGGDRLSNYQYLDRFFAGSVPYQGQTALLPSTPANPKLHWERTNKAELDLTMEFFKGRFGFTVESYQNISTDIIISQPISSITGYTSYFVNAPAKIRNRGLDISINSRNIQGKFNWTSRFNISFAENMLVSYGETATIPLGANYEVGRSMQNIRVYKYAGVDPATGNYFFTNAAGQTGPQLFTLSPDKDKTEYVDLAPKYFGSFTNSLSYKNFSFDFTFSFRRRTGLKFQAQQGFPNTPVGLFNSNGSISALRRWQKPGDITDVPKMTTNFATALFGSSNYLTSDGAYETITYANLQNAQVAYRFGDRVLKKIGITAANVFLQGQNLLYISKYKDMNPEVLAVSSTPPQKILTAGFNVTF